MSDLANALKLFGELVNGPRLALAGLAACVAIPLGAPGWLVGAVFFGTLLAFDIGRVGVRQIRKRHSAYMASREREAAANAKSIGDLERRETATRELPLAALAQLYKVRIEGLARFEVRARGAVDEALMGSPLVRSVGPRDRKGYMAEYEVEEWAWERLAEELDEMAKADPGSLKPLQRAVGKTWRS